MPIQLSEKWGRRIPRWLGYHITLWNIRWHILYHRVKRTDFWYYVVPRRDGGFPAPLFIDCPCTARQILEMMERLSQEPDPFKER